MINLTDIIAFIKFQDLIQRTTEQIFMFSIAILLSIFIGLIIGIFLYKAQKLSNIVFNILNIIETLPTIALLVLLIPFLGLGMKPTIFVSVLYAILPIARNCYVGLNNVEKNYIEIAHCLGLNEFESLTRIEIPLALPTIISGIRISIVFTMGVVTLGGLIAAGGLGASIQTGIQLYDKTLIYVSAVWVGILALIFDALAYLIERFLQKRFGHA